jgi:hypothetical protein
VAAGEDQPQLVVLDTLIGLLCRVSGVGDELLDETRLRPIEAGAPPHSVDGLEAAGRHEPRPRIGRHAFPRPLFHCRGKGIVQCLLGNLEVAEQPDQGGENATRVGAVDGVHSLAHQLGGVFTHRRARVTAY